MLACGRAAMIAPATVSLRPGIAASSARVAALGSSDPDGVAGGAGVAGGGASAPVSATETESPGFPASEEQAARTPTLRATIERAMERVIVILRLLSADRRDECRCTLAPEGRAARVPQERGRVSHRGATSKPA